MYFNLLVMFLEQSVNVTVWTVAYAIPYHASLPFTQFKVGYGIISLQAKKSKHSGIKSDLVLTNRSRWWGQTMWGHSISQSISQCPHHRYLIFNHVSHHFSINPTTVSVGVSEMRVELVHFVMSVWKYYFVLRTKKLMIVYLQFQNLFCAMIAKRDFQMNKLCSLTANLVMQEVIMKKEDQHPEGQLLILSNYLSRT